MQNFQQEPFSDAEFVINPEERGPVVLLLDTSYSMSGAPIAELNEGLATLKEELTGDSLAAKRVELSLITFGPVEVRNENGGEKVGHGSGGMSPLRAAQ